MVQFILEAVLLSLAGGTLAIITVHGLTQTATTVIIQAPYQFSLRNAAYQWEPRSQLGLALASSLP